MRTPNRSAYTNTEIILEPIPSAQDVADRYGLPVEVTRAMERSDDPEQRCCLRRLAMDKEVFRMSLPLHHTDDEARALARANAYTDSLSPYANWFRQYREDIFFISFCSLFILLLLSVALYAPSMTHFIEKMVRHGSILLTYRSI